MSYDDRYSKMNKKTKYVVLIKETNTITISNTKTGIAKFIGVSYWTIHRKLNNTNHYENNKYSIWSNVPVIKARQKRI